MNRATAIRWIEQMPLSEEEKGKAVEEIKVLDEVSIEGKINKLKSKAGGKFRMNKLSANFSVK